MTQDKSKKRKSIMENSNGANTPTTAQPQPPVQQASTPVSESRRESIAASTSAARRDSVSTTERTEKPTKKGPQQPERKQLSEADKQLYGVSYHDRLGSGPTFCYERINKILTTKSHAQHQRITNTLAELDIPSRLNMPTRAVVEEMEKLLNSIGCLLEIRKMNDKVEAEMKLERAKKAEREKHLAPPESPATAQANAETSEAAAAAEEKKQPENTADAANAAGSADDEAAEGQPPGPQPPQTQGGGEEKPSAEADKPADGGADVKQEAADEKAERPASSSGNKRSASVLSSVSDKSAKRQKK